MTKFVMCLLRVRQFFLGSVTFVTTATFPWGCVEKLIQNETGGAKKPTNQNRILVELKLEEIQLVTLYFVRLYTKQTKTHAFTSIYIPKTTCFEIPCKILKLSLGEQTE